ncbi:MAG: MarR family winged helix-turn-helix transcriptional regulator [Candidatus Pristimantibacillus sp.]
MHRGNDLDHVMRTIRHLTRMHQQQMNTLLHDYDIYPGQPPLMFALKRGPGRSQSELAKELDIKAATLTIMLNRMEKHGIVRREADSLDQRVSRIFLTDKGSSMLGEIHETLHRLEEQAMDGFNEEDQLLLRALLARISNNMKRYSGQTDDSQESVHTDAHS